MVPPMNTTRRRPIFIVEIAAILISLALAGGLVGQQSVDRGEPTKPTDASQSLTTFRTGELKWEQVLSEPTITQPLSVAFDDHERLWLVEYRQYPEPAGLQQQSRDIHWRIVYDKTP